MKNVQYKIESLKKQLKELKEKHQLSFDSVKKERGGGYHNSLTDTCLQVLCLLEGEIYKPYSWGGWCSRFEMRRGSRWENNAFTYYDYCEINSKHYGNRIGFVATKKELFNAVGVYTFQKIWRRRVENSSSELRGFSDFCEAVKSDHEFLLECVCEYYKVNYEVYKNRSLKIPELYVIIYEKNY